GRIAERALHDLGTVWAKATKEPCEMSKTEHGVATNRLICVDAQLQAGRVNNIEVVLIKRCTDDHRTEELSIIALDGFPKRVGPEILRLLEGIGHWSRRSIELKDGNEATSTDFYAPVILARVNNERASMMSWGPVDPRRCPAVR